MIQQKDLLSSSSPLLFYLLNKYRILLKMIVNIQESATTRTNLGDARGKGEEAKGIEQGQH